MPTTRSSARKTGGESSPPSSSAGSASNKRKADSSPAASPAKAKNAKAAKKQKTIEETLPDSTDDKPGKSQEASQDTDMKDADPTNAKHSNVAASEQTKDTKSDDSTSTPKDQPEVDRAEKTDQPSEEAPNLEYRVDEQSGAPKAADKSVHETKEPAMNGETSSEADKPAAQHSDHPKTEDLDNPEPKDKVEGDSAKPASTTESTTNQGTTTEAAKGDAVQESSQRENALPSSILEKGIIYFFFRGRVGIDDPSQVDDIARSYIVLRPLPRGAKLTDGAIGDQKNLRLLALPKKVLPSGPNDRFMVFVERSNASLEDLKKEFLSSSDYETKTAGTRHTPAATPIGEGVYALTSTGRDTHLAYVLTIPKELSEVQKDIGLEEKGSWTTSVKNPQHPGPAQAQLDKSPEFPKEILDEFRSLRWGQLQPKHLDYENCQLLLIGHKGNTFEKATETEGQETDPKEELEKLGEEDERRVEHLEGDDTVFEDLHIDAKEYPGVQTTW